MLRCQGLQVLDLSALSESYLVARLTPHSLWRTPTKANTQNHQSLQWECKRQQTLHVRYCKLYQMELTTRSRSTQPISDCYPAASGLDIHSVQDLIRSSDKNSFSECISDVRPVVVSPPSASWLLVVHVKPAECSRLVVRHEKRRVGARHEGRASAALEGATKPASPVPELIAHPQLKLSASRFALPIVYSASRSVTHYGRYSIARYHLHCCRQCHRPGRTRGCILRLSLEAPGAWYPGIQLP